MKVVKELFLYVPWVFIALGITEFIMGLSWGMYAIAIPIVIPLAVAVGANSTRNEYTAVIKRITRQRNISLRASQYLQISGNIALMLPWYTANYPKSSFVIQSEYLTVRRRKVSDLRQASLRVISSEFEEKRVLHMLVIHDTDHGVVIQLSKDIIDGWLVIDHRCAHLP